MEQICKDLTGECEALDAIVSKLDETGWETKTRFNDWTVKDEIAHVAFFDGTGKLSATDPDAFGEHVKAMASGQAESMAQLDVLKKMEYADLLIWWRGERMAMIEALAKLNPKDRLPWYGPSMSAVSFTTARLMETWAHGQDVVDVVNGERPATNRLRHIAYLGNITFGWTFTVRQMDVPTVPVRVELTSPSGELWTWGPEDAEDIVRGSAEGFCLVVTQRRHYADTDLVITGETAEKWMSLAQCFAGPPADGPQPGTFPKMTG
ncbi:MAG: TIGR03084 family protein [Deltaproteobacteria bacterium]|nr:TIGR03084 family protein [Deltaproteobacteria bacterium]